MYRCLRQRNFSNETDATQRAQAIFDYGHRFGPFANVLVYQKRVLLCKLEQKPM